MGKYDWTFSATQPKQDAYEPIIDKLNPCSSDEFNKLSEEQRDKLVKVMVEEVRKINVFPIYYYNKEGIKKEIQAAMDKTVCFTGNVLDISFSQGLTLLDFLFPNLHHVQAGETKNDTLYTRFFDDDVLKICLETALKTRKIINMRTTFFATSRFLWRSATNFSPMRAKAIYERFCPKDGVIYDYSAGFGGRMLGALSSSYNFTYIATDPNTETYKNLQQLGKYIEEVSGRTNSYVLYNECSEDVKLENESVDFAFSCPPFYTLEKYSDEETQSINKFPKYEDWLENYVRPTIKNCVAALKPEGLYGVNIVNYWMGGKKHFVANDWIKIAQEEGLFLQGIFPICSKARKKLDEDQDQIYIFSKSEDITIADYTEADTLAYWEEKLLNYEQKKKNKNPYIVCFDIFGVHKQIYDNYKDVNNFTEEEIKNAIKSKKPCKNCYFRTYKRDAEIPAEIEVKKPICKIDGQYFHTFAEAGRYLSTPRQTIAQSKNRQSKKIMGHAVEWF